MYRIVGADGKQYGPVTGDQLRRWIAEGRANAQTQVYVDGAAEWKPLGMMPEFTMALPLATPPIAAVSGSHVRRVNANAVWGMVLGILGLVCCCCCCANVICGTLGLIFSLIGFTQINERPDLYEGRGFAIAGIILSALALVLGILMLMSNAANGNFQHHAHYHWHFNPN